MFSPGTDREPGPVDTSGLFGSRPAEEEREPQPHVVNSTRTEGVGVRRHLTLPRLEQLTRGCWDRGVLGRRFPPLRFSPEHRQDQEGVRATHTNQAGARAMPES
jgi:hypothetical protein